MFEHPLGAAGRKENVGCIIHLDAESSQTLTSCWTVKLVFAVKITKWVRCWMAKSMLPWIQEMDADELLNSEIDVATETGTGLWGAVWQ